MYTIFLRQKTNARCYTCQNVRRVKEDSAIIILDILFAYA